MKPFTMKTYIPVFLLLFIFCISCRTATNSSTTGDNRKCKQPKKQAAGVTSRQDNATLQNQIKTLIRTHRAKVGVAIRFGDKETIICNDSTRYAMMSTFKFPLALAVLSKLDKKQLPLETEIYVTPSDLHPNTYSPLRDTRPGQIHVPLQSL